MRASVITVAHFEVMWLWNDYLPYLTLDMKKFETVPIAIRTSRVAAVGGHGCHDGHHGLGDSGDVFYLVAQLHHQRGGSCGAVKG